MKFKNKMKFKFFKTTPSRLRQQKRKYLRMKN